jgi:WD40 repeat protein
MLNLYYDDSNKLLFSGGQDRHVRIWSTTKATLLKTTAQFSMPVKAMVFLDTWIPQLLLTDDNAIKIMTM